MSGSFSTLSLASYLLKAKEVNTSFICLIKDSSNESYLSYYELYERSLFILHNLKEAGIKENDEVVIQIEDNESFLLLFWACLLGKIIPVPLSVGSQDEHKLKIIRVWETLNNPYLICEEVHAKRLEKFAKENGYELENQRIAKKTISVEVIKRASKQAKPSEIKESDIAYIQYSSGSTGAPKGVVLTHKNLVANTTGIASRSEITYKDSMLSWMPLTHDMGLICFHLTGLVTNINQYIIPTSLFIRRPLLWMDKTSEHKTTLLYSPNFGYQYFLSALDSVQAKQWDLSAVKIIYNGAEAISTSLCYDFINALKTYGLSPYSIFPGYGLAEASVAVSLPEVGQELRSYDIHRDFVNVGNKVRSTNEPGDKVNFVEVGWALDNCYIRIADGEDRSIADNHIGHIQIKGDNVTKGYYNNEVASKALFSADGWVKTGDLGFLNDGKLVITGRLKNIIIINGQNYYPQDIERVTYDIEELGLGKVVACGIKDDHDFTEELVLFILNKGTASSFFPLATKVKEVISKKLGVIVGKVIPVKKIPKTTSGKIQHFKLVEDYKKGEFDGILKEIEELQRQQNATTDLHEIGTKQTLVNVWEKLFQQKTSFSDNFFNSGLSSLQAIQFASVINETFNIQIALNSIFEWPSINALGDFINSQSAVVPAPIVAIPQLEIYEASDIQKRFWFLSQFENNSSAYNIPLCCRLKGDLKVEVLKKAVEVLCERHEILRTTFVTVSGKLGQRIHSAGNIDLIFHNEAITDEHADQSVNEIVNDYANTAFDLENGPLWKVVLLQISDLESVLLFNIHHIIADGWSLGIIVDEISAIYKNLLKGAETLLPSLPYQYKDYVAWKKSGENEESYLIHKEFWEKEFDFDNNQSLTQLPFVAPGAQRTTSQGNIISFELPARITEGLKTLSAANESTLFMTLIALLNTLFYKYSGETDITFGTDLAGRNEKGLNSQIGCYLNTLLLRTQFDKNDSFKRLLRRVKSKILKAYQHQEYSFDKLVEEKAAYSQLKKNGLFNVLVLLQNFDFDFDFKNLDDSIESTIYALQIDTAFIDLQFEFVQKKEAIVLNIRYSKDLFEEAQINRLGSHFLQLSDSVVENSGLPLLNYSLLPDQEKHQLLREFNRPCQLSKSSLSVTDLFELQVESHPNSTAIAYLNTNLSYKEVNVLANQLAHFLLKDYNVKVGERIGIMLLPSPYAVIGILATLKAGGVFVPIDPGYPAERINYILENSGIDLLLSDGKSFEYQGGLKKEKIILVDEKFDELKNCPAYNPFFTDKKDLAYINYTSGSTGKPKGVMIGHQSLIDYVLTFIQYFDLTSDEVVIQQSSLSFDTAIEEIFPVLCVSGKLVILKDGGRNVEELLQTIQSQSATLLSTTPLVINEINGHPEYLKSLRILISGGDVLRPAYITNLLGKADLYNTYGPTESTVCTTFNPIKSISEASNIGWPINNRKVYIVDESMQILPIGITGEICIGGAGLATGYVNNDTETSLRFTEATFGEKIRVYKTGDLGKWNENGSISFIGRKDTQLKIRGYRVELAEIENAILKLEKIENAVVIANEDPNREKYLAAFYIAKDLKSPDLRRYLHQQLPDYMVPRLLVALNEFPLTPNGKIDKEALLNREYPAEVVIEDAERLPFGTEQVLLEIWEGILGKPSIHILNNFFELGGNSIKATQLIAQIKNRLHVEVALKTIFFNPTVQELAKEISKYETVAGQTIQIAQKMEYYDVSPAQKRLWILDQFKENQIAYNLSWEYELKGELNVELLQRSFQKLVERHEILRTTFVEVDGEVKQKIHDDYTTISQSFVDLTQFDEAKKASLKDQLNQENKSTSFDLANGPLLRSVILKLDENSHLLLFAMHHIITDGWSMNILAGELVSFYNALKAGKESLLAPLSFHYKDYVHTTQIREINAGDEHKKYWMDLFEDEIPILALPTDLPRPIFQTYNGNTVSFILEKELYSGVIELSKKKDSTVFMVLLAAVYALLNKYTAQRDIILGIPVVLRDEEYLENQVGYFLNTLPIRTRFDESKPFGLLLEEVKENLIKGYEHKSYPFDKMVDDLVSARDLSRSPIFDVMVGFQNTGHAVDELKKLSGVAATPYPASGLISQFDLSIDFFELNDELKVSIEFNRDLFTASRIYRLTEHLRNILSSIIQNVNSPLSNLEYLSEREKDLVLNTFNDTALSFSEQLTVKELFEAQVDKSPDAVAVICDDSKLTYRELNEKANQLASYLRTSFDIVPDQLIGIMVSRSLSSVIAVLGVIKSGAAYVPIDPEYPQSRIEYIIEDTELEILLTDQSDVVVSKKAVSIIDLNDINEELLRFDSSNPEQNINPSNLVYVIYTSASTGLPKGVMVEHKNLVNIARGWTSAYNLNDFDVRSLQIASISFDVFCGDLCRALLNGGSMVICPSQTRFDLEALYQLILKNKINIFESTPALVIPLMDYIAEEGYDISFMEMVIFGSDTLLLEDYKRILRNFKGQFRIINSYGTTETTIDSSFYEVLPDEVLPIMNVPIGKPMANTQYYVLDHHQNPVAIGVLGELWIGGSGVSRGYVNLEAQSRDKFRDDPFRAGNRVYKSGDIARWLEDGKVEFMGRSDDQVKVRGYRIELGEIENTMLKHESVSQGAVMCMTDESGEKEIVGYYTGTAETESLRSFIGSCLPGYMVPAYLLKLDSLPLTGNGKLDRKRLPTPASLGAITGRAYEGPGNPTEDRLCRIWAEVLKRERIGIRDNFFELGGHSLKAIQVISRLHKELGVKIELRSLFANPTIAGLSKEIKKGRSVSYEEITAMAEQPYYELSHAQQRLWILDQFEADGTAYNMPWAYAFKGALNIEALEQSFNSLIERHEILRTVFVSVDGAPKQKVLSAGSCQFQLGYTDVSEKAIKGEDLQTLVHTALDECFRLDQWPLIRAGIIRTGEREQLLIFNMHHIISDGWSAEVMTDELVSIYQDKQSGRETALAPLAIQYKDYAHWQNSQLREGRFNASKTYWNDQFSGDLPVLELPLDYKRGSVKTFKGSSISANVGEELSRSIQLLSRQEGMSVFMVLVGMVKALLYRYTGQEDIIIGTAVAGRSQKSLEPQLGFYVNTLALRTATRGEEKAITLLNKVKKNVLEAYEHEQYPFDLLIEDLALSRDMSRSPLFDVMVVFQNAELNGARIEELKDIEVSAYNIPHTISKFDLTINFAEKDSALQLEVEYNTALFKAGSITRLIGHFMQLARAITENKQIRLDQIAYIPQEEQTLLIEGFNQTARSYTGPQTIQELFEQQVARTPDAIAVSDAEGVLSYRELNEHSNQLAHYLQLHYKIKQDELVGIMMEKSRELMVGILAILKSGGAYVPIDAGYPTGRKDYIIQDSGIRVLLSVGHPAEEPAVPVIDLTEGLWANCPTANLTGSYSGKDLIYVLYTSGTTGSPKGVQIEQHSVVNLSHWLKEIIYSKSDTPLISLLTASVNFDASVQQLFAPLLTGGQLILIKDEVKKDPSQYIRALIENKVDVIDITPAYLRIILSHLEESGAPVALKYTLVGGEALSEDLCTSYERIFGDKSSLINVYGITECTVNSSYEFISAGRKSDSGIGQPLSNNQLYILDRSGSPVPIGVKGELWIGGSGVSRGYVNLEAQSRDRFRDDPFRAGNRVYKSGDIARWLEDGRVEFMGRSDDQVKVRGYRIELGEIENTMLKHESVSQGAVMCMTDESGEKEIVGYYTGTAETESLRSFIGACLPGYMVPAYLLKLDSLPLTGNGKLDRKRLPTPASLGAITGRAYEGPGNPTEDRLCRIWAEVLKRERIGIRDNFFELGGHSLKAIQVISRLHKELGVKIELRSLFANPTIAGLSKEIKKGRSVSYEEITAMAEQPYYELSHAQQRLWILDQFEADGTAYNMPWAYAFKGALNIEALEQSFNSLIERHEILRTVFVSVDGAPKQKVLSAGSCQFQLGYTDVSEKAIKGEDLQTLVHTALDECFRLDQWPLIRAGIIRTGEREQLLIFNMHHIISDGWSAEVMTDELVSIYQDKQSGRETALAPLAIQYKDYAHWQNSQLREGRFNASKTYWNDQFSGDLPVLELPLDYKRGSVKTFKGSSISANVGEELSRSIQLLSRQEGMSVFMVLVGMVKALLYRYTGQEDIIIGTAVAGRSQKSLEPQLGFYVNTLALRTATRGEEKAITLLNKVKKNVLEAYEHEQYPFDLLIEDLALSRDMSRSPLFDVMVVFQNAELNGARIEELKDIEVSAYNIPHTISKFDLTINFAEKDSALQLEVEYNTALFKAGSITRLIGHFMQLARAITENKQIRLDQIAYIPQEEQTLLIEGFNQTARSYTGPQTIQELFEQQVARTPDAIAVSDAEGVLSYRELNEHSNQLAHYLQLHYKIKQDELVGIMMEKSRELMVGILAILKSGGAYVPIDAGYPTGRKDYIIQDSGIRVLLSVGHPAEEPAVPVIDLTEGLWANCPTANLTGSYSGKDLIYVLYTSGTTGSPKGVQIEQHSVVNLSHWLKEIIYSKSDTPLISLLTASVNFDASVQQLFAPLLTGGQLILIKDEVKKDPSQYIRALIENKVDVIDITPAYLGIILSHLEESGAPVALKYTLVGGEALSEDLCTSYERIFGDKSSLINVYGITECTVNSSYEFISTGRKSDSGIGQPLSNNQLYILDRSGNPVPIGVKGELWIGGSGVSRGYVNLEAQSRDKFRDDPFRAGNRVYKSGDIARWLEDGRVEFMGRSDDQVKVRGYRIELGEIENTMLKHESVSQGAVMCMTDESGEKEIVGYYTGTAETESLRSFIGSCLPGYMVPAYLLKLDSLPLTGNGKLDRKRLPTPASLGAITGRAYEGPGNPTEDRLCRIWAEVLKRERIGIRDNFFELGGHSLKAIQVISRLHKELGVKIELRSLFANPTIAGLSKEIEKGRSVSYEEITAMAEQPYYELSHAQQRLWILDQFEADGTAYNMPWAYAFKGALNIEALEQSFNSLIERHEILRTVFVSVDGEPKQKVNRFISNNFKLKYIDLRADQEARSKAKNIAIQETRQSFDLMNGPLLRGTLIRLADKEYVFLFTQHHIISDGWSVMVMMDELLTLYSSYLKGENNPLLPLEIQYKDYAHWQNNLLENEGHTSRHKAYWINQFVNKVPILELPADFPRPASKTFNGDVCTFEIEEAVFQKIRQSALKKESSVFITLIASLKILLCKYTNQTDIIIGSPVASRDSKELENQIGFYVNTLPLRTTFDQADTVETLLDKVKETVLGGYEHQLYPFDKIVEDLNLDRDLSRSPLFDVMAVLQNTGVDTSKLKQIEGLEVSGFEVDATISKFDLCFFYVENENTISCILEYNTDLFLKESIENLVQSYKQILSTAFDNTQQSLSEIECLSFENKTQLLEDFNDTRTDFPSAANIHQLFEAQVLKTPERVALTFEGRSFTYEELNQKSNQLSHYLSLNYNVKENDLIGIMTDRSEWMIVAMLAILKSGAAYVPIDPLYPKERIAYILNDTGLKILLTESKYITICDHLQWDVPTFQSYICLTDQSGVTIPNENEARLLWDYTAEKTDNIFAASGWINSYTNEVFEERDMEEFVENVIDKLSPYLSPDLKVLEVGCGSGLIMFRIAPLVSQYYGTDISQEILNKNKNRIENEGITNISLCCYTALEIDQLDLADFDLIIVNSVIQYFPDHAYLRKFLSKAINLLSENGLLFLGDIRDKDLQTNYYESLFAGKNNIDVLVNSKKHEESELFISRAFLNNYFEQHFSGSTVAFSSKLGRIRNELSLFRFDTFIRINNAEIASASDQIQKSQILKLALDELPGTDLNLGLSSSNLAYVIYTSGSTGWPKGVQIPHRSVLNFLNSMQKEPGITQNDRLLAVTTYTFDISVLEIFLPLAYGAEIFLLGRESAADPEILKQVLAVEKPTLMQATPATWNMLINSDWKGDQQLKVLCGGERLNRDLGSKLIGLCNTLWNVYGPTETTVWSTIKQIKTETDLLTIGRPIDNTQVYIVDSENRLVPPGVVGEILIGGEGLARGYWNRPELTGEKFIDVSFSPRSKVYKTGDLGRWSVNKEIIYLDRKDNQVKIRGHRIELGEIENCLLKLGNIEDVVVAAKKDREGIAFIVAYLVAGEPLEATALIQKMKVKLPEYMIPSYFVQLKELPKTTSGKIDRNTLPSPEGLNIVSNKKQVLPTTETEAKLVKIWENIIQRSPISTEDDFFEIGGHSLKATQLVSHVFKNLHTRIELRNVFQLRTISALAKAIDQLNHSAYEQIIPVKEKEFYDLSHAQKRLWILNEIGEEQDSYYMYLGYEFKGQLDLPAFSTAFNALIERHESLRTTFITINGEPMQQIHNDLNGFKLEYIDLSLLEGKISAAEAIQDEEIKKTFDLAKGPLLRAKLIRLEAEKYIFLFTIHHIICDGWSLGVIMEEVLELYNGIKNGNEKALKPLRIQYKDYASWQNEQLNEQRLKLHQAYWHGAFKEQVTALDLPIDFPRSDIKSIKGERILFSIKEKEADRLRDITKDKGATLYMVLLASLNILLSRYSEEKDVVIGSPIAGRNHIDTENQIGLFINTLPIRTKLNPDERYSSFLESVKLNLLKAYEHQMYPYDLLIEDLDLARNANRGHLFDVGFTWQNLNYGQTRKPQNFSISSLEWDPDYVKTDFWLHAWEAGNEIHFSFSYLKDLYKTTTIESIIQDFKLLLNTIAASPDYTIHQLIETLNHTRKIKSAMNENKIKEKNLEKFFKTPAKKVSLTEEVMILESFLMPGTPYPLVVTPNLDNLNLTEWLRDNHAYVKQRLHKHGAVLFRDFKSTSLPFFQEFVKNLSANRMSYVDQSSPRSLIDDNLYTSTDHPADQVIHMHNELSYSNEWPMQILFFCKEPSEEGGETPIADSRKVLSYLSQATKEKFAAKGIMYVRNLVEGFGLSWQTVYQTKDKNVVEAYCNKNNIDFNWENDRHLRISWTRPAIQSHPLTGEQVWFNHGFFFNALNLEASIREVLFSSEEYPFHTNYGDGTPIEASVIHEIGNAYEKSKAQFIWQKGDILLLDNMLMSHGRNSFKGPRSIVVGMTDPHSLIAAKANNAPVI